MPEPEEISILKSAIDTLCDSLANLAFVGERPTMPWNDYVQDGLVFHLDGIDKGGVDGQWTDLIGGVDFPNHDAIELENGWQFTGGYQYLGYANNASKSLNFSPDECTVEVCCYDDSVNNAAGSTYSGLSLFYFGAQNSQGTNATNPIYMNLCYYKDQRYINGMYVGNSVSVWGDDYVESDSPHIISMNKDRAFDNGHELNSLGATHWDSISGGRTIGAKWHPSSQLSNFCFGKIYAIRIYNRILSANEMLQNQRVDNARFNMGVESLTNVSNGTD